MNQYVTGAMIKQLRENKKMTQVSLAEKLNVSDKAVSKWETGRGYPDISLLELLSKTLGVSEHELLSGNKIINKNNNCNMLKSKFYVCPVCSNIVVASGEASISCCGVVLHPLDYTCADESYDKNHCTKIEKIDDEFFVTMTHEMTKEHYISFFAALRNSGIEIVKLYPESDAQCSFKISGTRKIFAYCNLHGLFEFDIRAALAR